jgi:hypothetical protein
MFGINHASVETLTTYVTIMSYFYAMLIFILPMQENNLSITFLKFIHI